MDGPLDGFAQDRRPRAVELRFLVDQPIAAEILAWAREQLAPDPHGIGPHQDTYGVTTLYFDTADYDVFHRLGSYRRAKYRIRRYDGSGVAFFERKLRTRRMLTKRRSIAPLADLHRLAEPPAVGIPADWFSRRIAARQLGPVCQIAYERSARQIVAGQSVARLTVDTNLRAWPLASLQFVNGSGTALLEGRAVVEVKFQEAPPVAFKTLVEQFALRPDDFSKYRLAVDRLGLVPEGDRTANATASDTMGPV